jgi:hypothetical protein
MRAQVATFAGCPIPSQFGSRQAPKKMTDQNTCNGFVCKCRVNLSRILFLRIGVLFGKIYRMPTYELVPSLSYFFPQIIKMKYFFISKNINDIFYDRETVKSFQFRT